MHNLITFLYSKTSIRCLEKFVAEKGYLKYIKDLLKLRKFLYFSSRNISWVFEIQFKQDISTLKASNCPIGYLISNLTIFIKIYIWKIQSLGYISIEIVLLKWQVKWKTYIDYSIVTHTFYSWQTVRII